MQHKMYEDARALSEVKEEYRQGVVSGMAIDSTSNRQTMAYRCMICTYALKASA